MHVSNQLSFGEFRVGSPVELVTVGPVVARRLDGRVRFMGNDAADIDRMVEYLRTVQQRKPMYVQPVDVASVKNFLTGFGIGCAACGLELEHHREKTEVSRGWEMSATGPVPQMEAAGMTPEEIMDELIEIEIAVVQFLAAPATDN